MSTLLLIPLQAIGIVMLADFLAGLVHWFEDAYGTADTPLIGPLLIRINIVHHHYPRFFTRLTWWQSSWDLLLIGLGILTWGWWAGHFSWQLVLFVLVGINANQVHKWSHRTRAENGPLITFLQRIYVLQTPRHHAVHHTDPKNTYYSPVTNLVNPLLERLQFWTKLESLIRTITGLTHREDTSNRGHGPGPAWLADYRTPDLKTNFPAPAAAALRNSCDHACASCRAAAQDLVNAAVSCPRRAAALTPSP